MRKRCGPGEIRPCLRCKRMRLECVPRAPRHLRTPRHGGTLAAAGPPSDAAGGTFDVGLDNFGGLYDHYGQPGVEPRRSDSAESPTRSASMTSLSTWVTIWKQGWRRTRCLSTMMRTIWKSTDLRCRLLHNAAPMSIPISTTPPTSRRPSVDVQTSPRIRCLNLLVRARTLERGYLGVMSDKGYLCNIYMYTSPLPAEDRPDLISLYLMSKYSGYRLRVRRSSAPRHLATPALQPPSSGVVSSSQTGDILHRAALRACRCARKHAECARRGCVRGLVGAQRGGAREGRRARCHASEAARILAFPGRQSWSISSCNLRSAAAAVGRTRSPAH